MGSYSVKKHIEMCYHDHERNIIIVYQYIQECGTGILCSFYKELPLHLSHSSNVARCPKNASPQKS